MRTKREREIGHRQVAYEAALGHYSEKNNKLLKNSERVRES